MTNTLQDIYQRLNLAITSALSDVFLIGGIAAINYGGEIAKQSLLPNVPGGYPRMIAAAGFDATIDISKHVLFDISHKHAIGT